MDTQKIAKEYRLSGWCEAVKARAACGQSVKAFCRENSIAKSTYYYRQKKLREAACTELAERQKNEINPTPEGWARLAKPVHRTIVEGTLAVEINGCQITVTNETDPSLLLNTCRVLRAL